jgi:hypothetical protein
MVVVATMLVLVGAGLAIAYFGRDDDGLSADCQQAENALRPWGATMPGVYATLPTDIARPPEKGEPGTDYAAAGAREAKAANDIRLKAALEMDPTLRSSLLRVADAFDMLSRSRTQPTVPSVPSKDFFAATTNMNDAIHQIVVACPGIGDPSTPPPVRPS